MSHLSRPIRRLGTVIAVAIMAASLSAGIAVAKSGSHHSAKSSMATGASNSRPAHVKPGVGPGQGTGVQSLGPAPGAPAPVAPTE